MVALLLLVGCIAFDTTLSYDEYYDYDVYYDDDKESSSTPLSRELARPRRYPDSISSLNPLHADDIDDTLKKIMVGRKIDDWNLEMSTDSVISRIDATGNNNYTVNKKRITDEGEYDWVDRTIKAYTTDNKLLIPEGKYEWVEYKTEDNYDSSRQIDGYELEPGRLQYDRLVTINNDPSRITHSHAKGVEKEFLVYNSMGGAKVPWWKDHSRSWKANNRVSESALVSYDSSTAMYMEPTSNTAPTRSTREMAAVREREELRAYMNNMTGRVLTASTDDSGWNDQHSLEPIVKAILRGSTGDENATSTTENQQPPPPTTPTTAPNATAASTGTLPLCVTTTEPPTTTTTTKKKTTRPFDIEKFLDIIANLTYDYYTNLTEQVNETLHKMGVPTCGTPTTTTETTTTEPRPVDYAGIGPLIVAKCFVCGLEDTGIPYNANCADAFAGDFLPLVPQDPAAKGHIARFKKYCRYKDVNNYELNVTMPRSLFGRWTGGCSVRWTDLTGVYTQRACRNRRQAATGRHFGSKRMAKLEMTLAERENGCIVSPVASLLPLSRGISLFARFHACVCTGNWCNDSARTDSDVRVTAVTAAAAVVLPWTYG